MLKVTTPPEIVSVGAPSIILVASVPTEKYTGCAAADVPYSSAPISHAVPNGRVPPSMSVENAKVTFDERSAPASRASVSCDAR